MLTSLNKLWRGFRRLPIWLQVAAWVVGGLALLAPFGDDGQEVRVTGASPPSTSAPAPTAERQPEPPAPASIVTTTTVPPGVPATGDDTTIDRVIDGDTVQVSGGVRVRLIGIDAPETSDPAASVGCFGPEATRYLNELIPVGTRVRLAYDVERLDQYGRTLAYVYKLSDGVFVNQAVARNGFANQLTVAPNVRQAETFRLAVADARAANLGMWRACQPTTTAPRVTVAPVTAAPVTSPPATSPPATRTLVAPTTTAAAGGGCHPSYSGACVPTGFSDVDCGGGGGNGPGYVYAKRFQVVGPDVYGLDSDGDGVACES